MFNSNKVFIVAEAGVNHNGSLKTAKQLVNVAADSGVDAVKFQTFKAERIISKFAPKAEYQRKMTSKNESQLEMVKRLELRIDDQKRLVEHCQKNDVMFISSPFDLESIDILNDLGVEIFKIPSGEITNLPYLRRIGSLERKIILSTGMSDLGEIEDALEILMESGTLKKDIAVLHCNTEYPTPIEHVNLRAMLTIKKAFKVDVGYSDHTLGTEVPIAAVALGATIIEKHFTLDRNMEGPDHRASLEPDELKSMVCAIRNIEKALGDGMKKPSPSEIKNRSATRKSIVAAENIEKGDIFSEKNIAVKRPGMGMSPMEWDNLIGKVAKRNFNEDELIEL